MGGVCLKKNQVIPADGTSSDACNGNVHTAARQAILIKLSKDLVEENDTGKVLQRVADAACALLRCEHSWLFLSEHDATSMVFCESPSSAPGKLQIVQQPCAAQGHIGRACFTGDIGNLFKGASSVSLGVSASKSDVAAFRVAPDTRSVICIPWKDAEGNTLGVLQATDKQGADSRFDAEDEELVSHLLTEAVRHRLTSTFMTRCGSMTSLPPDRNALKFDSLLAIMSAVMSANKLKDLRRLIGTIILKAQSLHDSDRAALFAVDTFKNELVGYEFTTGSQELQETRIPMSGVVGSVAQSGQLLNITEASSFEDKFIQDADMASGYKTKTMLIAPLTTSKGRVVAVMRLTNKVGGGDFVASDEKEFSTVSALISDVLQRVLLDSSLLAFFEETNDVDVDVKDMLGGYVDNEDVTESRAVLCRAESRKVTGKSVDSGAAVALMRKWGFDHFEMHDSKGKGTTDTSYITGCLKHLDYLSEFNVKKGVVETCIQTLRERYIKTSPYHNWSHAFSTFHVIFAMMSSDILPPGALPVVDEFALLLAALGHDVEHPGVNNQFLINNRDTLALRYNDISVLENHHASVTCEILSDLNLSLAGQAVARFRKVVVSAILATDMAKHHEELSWLETTEIDVFGALAAEEPLDPESALKLSGVALHCADLAHPTLPWDLHRRLSLLCSQEFFAQYQEEQKLGLPSLPFMGKDPKNLPGLAPTQVGFVRFVAMPLWSALQRLIAGTDMLEEVIETIGSNQDTWQKIADGELIVDEAGVLQPGTAILT